MFCIVGDVAKKTAHRVSGADLLGDEPGQRPTDADVPKEIGGSGFLISGTDPFSSGG